MKWHIKEIVFMRLWDQISNRRRIQLISLVFFMIIASFSEVLSIGAIIPFLSFLIAPDPIFESQIFQYMITAFGMVNREQIIVVLTMVFIISAILAATSRLFLLWLQTKIVFSIASDLSSKIYLNTLYQPYHVHCFRNSSETISGIVTKTNSIVYGTLLPIVTIISSCFLLSAILITLIVINPLIAICTFGSLSLIYFLIGQMTKNKLSKNGLRVSVESDRVIKSLQEGLGGIRDVLLDGNQKIYCELFSKADIPMRKAQASVAFISLSPRFLIEAFGISFIALLAYILSQRQAGISDALPLLGAAALGGQRTLPIFQQLFYSWSTMKGNRSSLFDVIQLLEQGQPSYSDKEAPSQISFAKSIVLQNVHFRYGNDLPWVLLGANLEIMKGSRVGIKGLTGGGKSTLLDILLGLLSAQRGNLLIDNNIINSENVRSWQARVSHVPQNIYLSDATIIENIAFGIPFEKIDLDRVMEAANKAQIASTIETWENKYNTLVGERGVRLSGGQRQRIGIARAFYKRADVIIFDEATSALDEITESNVLNSIMKIDRGITIILVSHRQSALDLCDTVYEIKNSKIYLK